MKSAEAEPLPEAYGALERHDWHEAFDTFLKADGGVVLTGPDLEAWAGAAWFSGHADQGIEALERAFKVYVAEGNGIRAAHIAIDLVQRYAFKSQQSIASGWLRRGEKLLESEPESYVHGYLALAHCDAARASDDIESALSHANDALQIASRFADPDLQASAMTALGTLKILLGDTDEGFALMEDAAMSAVNGELSPFVTGVTCCSMISACRDLTDYQRASEWTEATERWCQRQSVGGFPGVCRVHRAEVVAFSGAWERAEQELRQATRELAAYNATPPMADGFYALGDIRLHMGDFAGAEEAFRQAHSLGRDPQPGLALTRLAQGNARSAASAINSAVADETWDKLARVKLLPAQVQIAIAIGDVQLAHKAAEELSGLVESYTAPAMQAIKHETWGRVLLAEGDAVGAARELRSGIREWRTVGAPYELARGRALLASALRATQEEDAADIELQAARDEFVRLGAKHDAIEAERAIQAAVERRTGPVQVRKAFMFTDIVGSTNLAELLDNEAWQQLLAWHDETLRALFLRSGGQVVNSTGDGFFVAFDSARQGIDCAIAIQRALSDHRRTSGFAPSVRIGLHTAEANRHGEDYSGLGVHVAARVAALAGGGEIVASMPTLSDAGDVSFSEPREANLKGVATPVTVASVVWD